MNTVVFRNKDDYPHRVGGHTLRPGMTIHFPTGHGLALSNLGVVKNLLEAGKLEMKTLSTASTIKG